MYESLGAIDDPLIRLEAALGYENANWRPGLADSKAADLLAAALESCGLNTEDPRYVCALASFGRALGFAGETKRARDISHQAIEHARATGSPAVVMHALETSLWHGLTPDMCETQFERSTELCEMASSRRDYETLNSASHFRALVSYQAGRPDDLAAAAADMKRSTRASGNRSSTSSAPASRVDWHTCVVISPALSGGPVSPWVPAADSAPIRPRARTACRCS